MQPGATAIISLYGRLFFFNPLLFPVARWALQRLLKAPAKRDGIQYTKNYEEFYRYMDGPTNPIGRYYTDSELQSLIRQFTFLGQTRSHFPTRFLKLGSIPIKKVVPEPLIRYLDRHAGMMCNLQLAKPAV